MTELGATAERYSQPFILDGLDSASISEYLDTYKISSKSERERVIELLGGPIEAFYVVSDSHGYRIPNVLVAVGQLISSPNQGTKKGKDSRMVVSVNPSTGYMSSGRYAGEKISAEDAALKLLKYKYRGNRRK